MAAAAKAWEARRTDETRNVEEVLKQAGWKRVDAYRYNEASIRVRVIDPRFEKMKRAQRVELVEPHLEKLPFSTQIDIITLHVFSPADLKTDDPKLRWANKEFENPQTVP